MLERTRAERRAGGRAGGNPGVAILVASRHGVGLKTQAENPGWLLEACRKQWEAL